MAKWYHIPKRRLTTPKKNLVILKWFILSSLQPPFSACGLRILPTGPSWPHPSARATSSGGTSAAICAAPLVEAKEWPVVFGFYGKKSHGSHAVQHMFRKKTIHAVRNDASRHVNFFLFDSLSRVAGVRWPHSMGKNHPLNPFVNCFWGSIVNLGGVTKDWKSTDKNVFF